MFKLDPTALKNPESKHRLRKALNEMDIFSELLFDFMLHSSFEDQLAQSLANPQQCVVRLYIFEAFDLASRDIGSDSDPFLKISCGKFKYDGSNEYQLDEPNPKYHKGFEFNATFPGAPPLEIELWDYDDLFGDDLIGKTCVDLDDRMFCQGWKLMQDKPIEYRELYHESSSMSQGSVICWVEIHESNKKKDVSEMRNITPEPMSDYQLRLAVYDA